MRAALIFFGLLITVPVFSQGSNRHVLLADSLYRYASYAKAVEHYEKANKKKQDGALFIKIGDSKYKMNQYSEAVESYSKAESDEAAWTVASQLNYIEALRSVGDKEGYQRMMAKWNGLPQDELSRIEGSLFSETLFYMDSSIYNVDEGWMNSDESDFSPSYAQEGILFTSGRGKGNTSRKRSKYNNENYLDLYYTSLEDRSAAIPFKVNTKYHDGPIVYFNKGQNVLFTRNAKTVKNSRQLALFEADVDENGKWKNIRELPFNNDDYSVSHPAINEKGTEVYFVSDMEGGFGGTDIYYAERINGEWQTPVNLGSDINTKGNEMFPYFYNSELFFASNGHLGLGGLDIYVAEPLAQKNRYMVRNLGYPINTPQDDFALITDNGKTGFLSSNRRGNDDIFEFIKDKIIVELSYVDESRESISEVETIMGGDTISSMVSNIATTRVYLDQNDYYELTAHHDKYVDSTYAINTGQEFFMARTIMLYEEIMRGRVDLYPFAVNSTQVDVFIGRGEKLVKADNKTSWQSNFDISADQDSFEQGEANEEVIRQLMEDNGYEVVTHPRIERINFDFDKSAIRPSEHEKLERVADLLKQYVATTIIISAHTDERGSEAYNQRLSQRRADSTRKYLVKLGVEESRLKTVAYGESMLLITCDPCTNDQHAENRRVTFDVDSDQD